MEAARKRPRGSGLRIVMLTLWYPREAAPGEGAFVYYQVRALRALGAEVRVVHPLPLTPAPVRWLNRRYRDWHRAPTSELRDGVVVDHPRYLTLPRHLLHGQVSEWLLSPLQSSLTKLHREWPFQLIHAHATYPVGDAANRLRDEHLPGVRVVHTIHRTCIVDSPEWGGRARRRVRAALLACDRAIFVSEDGRKRARDLAGPELDAKSRVIRNGVDPALFASAADDVKRDERVNLLKARHHGTFNVLFVGYLCQRKGVPELIDAFARVAGRAPGRFKLFLVGRDQLGSSLARQVAQHRLDASVVRVGEVAPDEVATWMRFADAFVLPSRSEGCPTVLFEALAAGLPSIFTRSAGGAEIVGHEREAMLVAPGDVLELAAAIERLEDDPEFAQRMGRRGRELVTTRYPWTRNAQEVLRIYEETLGRQESARAAAGGVR